MELLKNKLAVLKRMRYLDSQLDVSNKININLLENAKRLRQQIEAHCFKLNNEIEPLNIISQSNSVDQRLGHINPRLHFVYTNEFRNNMQHLRGCLNNSNIIRMKSNAKTIYDLEQMPLSFNSSEDETPEFLITDYFVRTANGLAKLYKIQRERKIWWMRISADPSRYYLEPYKFPMETAKVGTTSRAQSITIKARLSIGDVGMEHITLVPLNDACLQNARDFEVYDERTKQKQLPTVIRSVINLDAATCALIFDGAANNKRENTLFLNRKLTPFQCLVTTLNKVEKSQDLEDLCTHISNVVQRAGLRIVNIGDYIGINAPLNEQLDLADKLGITYSILPSHETLLSGLLELRSRDTTLNETIHISDIPGYLLNIFHAS